ncbi:MULTISPECIES: PmeII family type II restriction endonuclease [Sphingobacterium]|uniref:PmeII family type II restriction endonuclease n=1 Tax=Sphingobacterium TaxID=28453 RepID=UPI001969C0F8|nr:MULTISPECIES: PmeII family type II restriction endonuclease [unclassified Sphingobacterium]
MKAILLQVKSNLCRFDNMNQLNIEDVIQYVKANIGDFHAKRLSKIENIKLKDVLKAKNPYMFKAKNVITASEIIDGILSAYISSSEEGIFGNWLEQLAIHINQLVYCGRKAGVEGLDLEFEKDGKRYMVTIKSGPNWGNDSQIKKMIDHFNSARKRLATSGAKVETVFVNGCCYGKSQTRSEFKQKGNYYKLCGQRFWELISGDTELYKKIIEPLGHESQLRNEEFNLSYSNLKNKLEKEFLNSFTDDNGGIDWEKLVEFNSGTIVPREKKTRAGN